LGHFSVLRHADKVKKNKKQRRSSVTLNGSPWQWVALIYWRTLSEIDFFKGTHNKKIVYFLMIVANLYFSVKQ